MLETQKVDNDPQRHAGRFS